MQARKRKHHGTVGHKSAKRSLYMQRDLDQIQDDIKKGKLPPKIADDDEKRLCCIACARYFLDSKALSDHEKTKAHKRRLKDLSEKAYCEEDALIGAGKGIPRAGYDDDTKTTNKQLVKDQQQ